MLRGETIAAARRLLISEGPAALTLQRVASAAGMTHGNITHHFGTVGNLQATLAEILIDELVEVVKQAVANLRYGDIDERTLVDIVFDRFDLSGIGRLFGWLAAQSHPQLAVLYRKFRLLLGDLQAADAGPSGLEEAELSGVISTVVISALGASLIGSGLATALDLPETFTRSGIADGLVARRRRAWEARRAGSAAPDASVHVSDPGSSGTFPSA